jgi:hypothetical protein
MYITEQEAAEFESANPTTAGIKLTKYEKEQRSVGFVWNAEFWEFRIQFVYRGILGAICRAQNNGGQF